MFCGHTMRVPAALTLIQVDIDTLVSSLPCRATLVRVTNLVAKPLRGRLLPRKNVIHHTRNMAWLPLGAIRDLVAT